MSIPSRWGIVTCTALLLGFLWAWQPGAAPVTAQEPTPAPGEVEMIPIEDMFEVPVLPENPTQADYGRLRYYYVCMACHGDLGQGLTPEWIEQAGLERGACWASKCHASNHPPEGFKLPRTIPGVVGPTVLAKFRSAKVLHDYIAAAMPWHAPGSLEAEEYWQLTAFILEINGVDPGPEPLNDTTAALVTWGQAGPTGAPSPTPTAIAEPGLGTALPWVVGIAAAGLAVLAGIAWAILRTKHL